MRTLTTRSLFTALVLTGVFGLSACEPRDPADDIGDNIEQVNKAPEQVNKNIDSVNDSRDPMSVDTPESTDSSEPMAPPERPLRPVRELPLENEPTTEHPAHDTLSHPAPSTNDGATDSQDTVATPDNTGAPVAGSVKEQRMQQEEQAQQTAESKAVTQEADQKLDEILKETSDKP